MFEDQVSRGTLRSKASGTIDLKIDAVQKTLTESKKEQTVKEEAIKTEYYPWECVSIFRPNFSTLDLVIKDYNFVLALLHILH